MDIPKDTIYRNMLCISERLIKKAFRTTEDGGKFVHCSNVFLKFFAEAVIEFRVFKFLPKAQSSAGDYWGLYPELFLLLRHKIVLSGASENK